VSESSHCGSTTSISATVTVQLASNYQRCKIIGKDLNVTSELEELLESGILTVFKEKVLALDNFFVFFL
jgi:hypothetical protein